MFSIIISSKKANVLSTPSLAFESPNMGLEGKLHEKYHKIMDFWWCQEKKSQLPERWPLKEAWKKSLQKRVPMSMRSYMFSIHISRDPASAYNILLFSDASVVLRNLLNNHCHSSKPVLAIP